MGYVVVALSSCAAGRGPCSLAGVLIAGLACAPVNGWYPGEEPGCEGGSVLDLEAGHGIEGYESCVLLSVEPLFWNRVTQGGSSLSYRNRGEQRGEQASILKS